jgi:hypothetical protein
MMFLSRVLIIIIATVAVLLPRGSAMSQNATGPPRCADRAYVVAALHAIHGETLVARGLSKAGLLIEIYTALHPARGPLSRPRPTG